MYVCLFVCMSVCLYVCNTLAPLPPTPYFFLALTYTVSSIQRVFCASLLLPPPSLSCRPPSHPVVKTPKVNLCGTLSNSPQLFAMLTISQSYSVYFALNMQGETSLLGGGGSFS